METAFCWNSGPLFVGAGERTAVGEQRWPWEEWEKPIAARAKSLK